jgi:PKD repeat protein
MGISGGTQPYDFSWNNGAVTPSINNLSAGSYQLVLMDANSCQVTSSIIAIETTDVPAALFNYTVIDSVVWFSANINMNANQYNWSFGDGQTGIGSQHQIIYNNSGLYTVTLTATNTNCNLSDITSKIININLTTSENRIIFKSFTLAPNPSNGQFYLDFKGFEQGQYNIEIYNAVSQLIHTEQIDINGDLQRYYDLINTSGVYHLRLYDVKNPNKRLSRSFIIE